MGDDWDFYSLRVDDEPASIFVDLGIRAEAPIQSHPTMAYVRVLMLKPREDGLSSQDEFDDLVALEDRIVEKLAKEGWAIFVGRNTSGGNRDFYFYTRNAAGFEATAKKAMREFPSYQYQMGTRRDADWRTYFEFLHPSQRSMQLIMNRRVRQQLEKNGDDLNKERKVDHLVLLPTLEAQSTFVSGVKGEGFSIECAPNDANDDGQFSVEFSRSDRPAEIDDLVLSLFDRTTALGGVYDGWGCHIEP